MTQNHLSILPLDAQNDPLRIDRDQCSSLRYSSRIVRGDIDHIANFEPTSDEKRFVLVRHRDHGGRGRSAEGLDDSRCVGGVEEGSFRCGFLLVRDERSHLLEILRDEREVGRFEDGVGGAERVDPVEREEEGEIQESRFGSVEEESVGGTSRRELILDQELFIMSYSQ